MAQGCHHRFTTAKINVLLKFILVVLSLKQILSILFFYLSKIFRQYFYLSKIFNQYFDFYLSKNWDVTFYFHLSKKSEYFAEHWYLVLFISHYWYNNFAPK